MMGITSNVDVGVGFRGVFIAMFPTMKFAMVYEKFGIYCLDDGEGL